MSTISNAHAATPVTTVTAVTGPMHERIHDVLASYREYALYCAGVLSHREWVFFLESCFELLVRKGLSIADVLLAMRFPSSSDEFVRVSLASLAAHGIVPGETYDIAAYDAAAALARKHYVHGPYQTSIFPEEARLLFAIADILRPKSLLVLGSYYGYWAYWAVAAMARSGGRAVFVDPDPRAQSASQINMSVLNLEDRVQHVVETGQAYLASETCHFDLVVLDAEGSRHHPDPEQRGKAIYAPLLRAALPRLTADARIVCHNIVLTDYAECLLFKGFIQHSRDELAAFSSEIERVSNMFVECPSTQGIGAARLTSREYS